MPEYEVFSGPYFPVFRPEKSPYWGIFYAVINPFVPNVSFLYPLKTTENYKVFWCFQWVEKRCTGNEWVVFFVFRSAYHITSYFLFYFNIFLGIFSCFLRLFFGILFGVVFMQRLQKSTLPRQYEKRDPGENNFFLKNNIILGELSWILCVCA